MKHNLVKCFIISLILILVFPISPSSSSLPSSPSSSSIRRRGLRHRANYFKMMTKKNSNGFNRPVRPDTFSVMLPKGFVPPSGSSPCHNQNPNSASTLFCDLSKQP
ncbi:hypothetical protein BRARA_A00960 [Brassica rapa]|uniref:VQ domain-containing protein n=1 Tax=Brassica campestris TaxID=3711 RepID=A0A398AS77_BRACM|nr:hypothetical protein BRARA_A00960 [Brassica rapa]